MKKGPRGFGAGEEGLTLVELLVAMAIAGLMIGAIFAFYMFGTKVFNQGTEKAGLQSGLRMAAEIITKEVRYADFLDVVDVDVIPEDLELLEENERYVYLQGSPEERIVILSPDGETVISSDIPVTGLTFDLDGKMLEFELKAAGKKGDYSLESKVWLFNTGADIDKDPTSAIHYWKAP